MNKFDRLYIGLIIVGVLVYVAINTIQIHKLETQVERLQNELARSSDTIKKT